VELVRSAWVRYIRQYNRLELGDTADLHEFLFGSERNNLSAVRGILTEIQEGSCFYCKKRLQDASEVDHFIPWTTYPVDLGHNFVLAHGTCNSAKGCLLASEEHLSAWVERNVKTGASLGVEFDRAGNP
jgi:5-methylcytosine-specific restriction endonuclease McrA